MITTFVKCPDCGKQHEVEIGPNEEGAEGLILCDNPAGICGHFAYAVQITIEKSTGKVDWNYEKPS